MKRINENLLDKNENYILPFFWQHGEETDLIKEYMGKIDESGIKAVCVEARPHPDFLGEKWWTDVNAIIDEAKNRDMKVWMFDDSHFPTGLANGEVKNNYPHLRKRFLKLQQLDYVGPMEHAQAIIKYAVSDPEDKIEGVYLAKKINYTEVDPNTIIDLTKNIKDNKLVSFSLPEGEWRLLTVVSTFNGGEPHTEGYLNPIDPEATDVLINTVYEAHYEKYKDEFGKTFAGFFSDEPRFGNMHGPQGSIGRFDMVLPWREDLVSLLDEKAGFSTAKYLPLLFVDGGDKAHQMRYIYMDLVSELYSIHFNKRLGDWCRAHGVEYIGHVIEDNNSHARLGYGAGHFFRSMEYQDMSGVDVVLHQLMPGMDNSYNKAMTKNGWDGEFFHYALAKLGTSLGHIDPKKKGRTMCEVFGAYGWAEGNRMMKFIQDHMLVRGVNAFIPHAFSLKDYPDRDCPPHMYAHGKNPQFKDFKVLMDYTNRMSHLLTGGVHHAPVAISYHAEAEWSGEYMLLQKPAAVLCRNQIDYDILPIDTLNVSSVEDKKLKVHNEEFKGLVVPYAQALPIEYMEKLNEFANNGLKVYFIDNLPERASNNEDAKDVIEALENNSNIQVVTLEALATKLREENIYEIKTSDYQPYLRYYHYEQEDGHIFMFVNEEPYKTISTTVTLPMDKECYWYDGLENKLSVAPLGKEKALELSPYESAVLIFPNQKQENAKEIVNSELVKEVEVNGPYNVSFATAEEYPNFKDNMILDELKPMQMVEGKEDFAGFIKYEMDINIEKKEDIMLLELSGVMESARVLVNNSDCGVKICPPYNYDITNELNEGKNSIAIEVTTTLVREQYDWLSQFMILEPTGITGKITIKAKEEIGE